MTADFQRVYGLRLISAVKGRTFDELADLIKWLPSGSAFHAAQASNPKLFGWSATEDMLLGIMNLIVHQTYVIAQVQSPKKIPVPKSIVGPRGDQKASADKQDMNTIARGFLDAQKG